jgi:hypothetical protein
LEDIHNGSLRGLVLEGINAPEGDAGGGAPAIKTTTPKFKNDRGRK